MKNVPIVAIRVKTIGAISRPVSEAANGVVVEAGIGTDMIAETKVVSAHACHAAGHRRPSDMKATFGYSQTGAAADATEVTTAAAAKSTHVAASAETPAAKSATVATPTTAAATCIRGTSE